MTDQRQYLIHLNTDEFKKVPAVSGINFGEIAINYASGSPEIMFKTQSGDSDDTQYIVHVKDQAWVEQQIAGTQTDIEGKLQTLSASTIELSGVTKSFSAATHEKFDTVSGYFLEHIADVSGQLFNYTETVSGRIKSTIDDLDTKVQGFSAQIIADVNKLSGDASNDITAKYNDATGYTNTVSGNIANTIYDEHNSFTAFSAYVIDTYATSADTYNAIDQLKQDIGRVYQFKGSVPTYEDLPTEDVKDGYVYNVLAAHGNIGDPDYYPAGSNFAWQVTGDTADEGQWDHLGGVIDLSDYATKAEVSAVSASIVTHVSNVSGYLYTDARTISGAIETTINAVSGALYNDIRTVSGAIENRIDAEHNAFTAFSGYMVENYTTTAYTSDLSGWIASHVEKNETDIANLSAGVESVSGYIIDYVDNTVSASIATTVANLSGSAINIETKLGQLSGETMAIQSGYVRTIQFAENADYGATVQKAENATGSTYTFDFSKLHINCGSF